MQQCMELTVTNRSRARSGKRGSEAREGGAEAWSGSWNCGAFGKSICSFEGTKYLVARWLSWLERRPVTAEVVGSIPIRVAGTKLFGFVL